MKSQKINLKNRRGQNIVGILIKPEERDLPIIGTAVLQHGYGSTKESASIGAIQKALLINGFQVFNFDSPNSVGESDGEYRDARLGLHADDFEDVTDWVLKQDWYVGNLIIGGGSMGGFSVVRYAERNSKQVKFLIGLVPVVSGLLRIETMKLEDVQGFKKWEERGFKERESGTIPGLIRYTPWNFVEESKQHDNLIGAKKLTMPTLLIAAENDIWILPEHVQMLFDEMPTGNKTFEIIKGAPHMLRNHVVEVSKIIDSWLKDQLKNSE